MSGIPSALAATESGIDFEQGQSPGVQEILHSLTESENSIREEVGDLLLRARAPGTLSVGKVRAEDLKKDYDSIGGKFRDWKERLESALGLKLDPDADNDFDQKYLRIQGYFLALSDLARVEAYLALPAKERSTSYSLRIPESFAARGVGATGSGYENLNLIWESLKTSETPIELAPTVGSGPTGSLELKLSPAYLAELRSKALGNAPDDRKFLTVFKYLAVESLLKSYVDIHNFRDLSGKLRQDIQVPPTLARELDGIMPVSRRLEEAEEQIREESRAISLIDAIKQVDFADHPPSQAGALSLESKLPILTLEQKRELDDANTIAERDGTLFATDARARAIAERAVGAGKVTDDALQKFEAWLRYDEQVEFKRMLSLEISRWPAPFTRMSPDELERALAQVYANAKLRAIVPTLQMLDLKERLTTPELNQAFDKFLAVEARHFAESIPEPFVKQWIALADEKAKESEPMRVRMRRNLVKELVQNSAYLWATEHGKDAEIPFGARTLNDALAGYYSSHDYLPETVEALNKIAEGDFQYTHARLAHARKVTELVRSLPGNSQANVMDKEGFLDPGAVNKIVGKVDSRWLHPLQYDAANAKLHKMILQLVEAGGIFGFYNHKLADKDDNDLALADFDLPSGVADGYRKALMIRSLDSPLYTVKVGGLAWNIAANGWRAEIGWGTLSAPLYQVLAAVVGKPSLTELSNQKDFKLTDKQVEVVNRILDEALDVFIANIRKDLSQIDQMTDLDSAIPKLAPLVALSGLGTRLGAEYPGFRSYREFIGSKVLDQPKALKIASSLAYAYEKPMRNYTKFWLAYIAASLAIKLGERDLPVRLITYAHSALAPRLAAYFATIVPLWVAEAGNLGVSAARVEGFRNEVADYFYTSTASKSIFSYYDMAFADAGSEAAWEDAELNGAILAGVFVIPGLIREGEQTVARMRDRWLARNFRRIGLRGAPTTDPKEILQSAVAQVGRIRSLKDASPSAKLQMIDQTNAAARSLEKWATRFNIRLQNELVDYRYEFRALRIPEGQWKFDLDLVKSALGRMRNLFEQGRISRGELELAEDSAAHIEQKVYDDLTFYYMTYHMARDRTRTGRVLGTLEDGAYESETARRHWFGRAAGAEAAEVRGSMIGTIFGQAFQSAPPKTFTSTLYYEVLGLRKGAPVEEIRDRYRSLTAQYYPGAGGRTPNAEKWLRVKEAYDVLMVDQQAYDRWLGTSPGLTDKDRAWRAAGGP